MLDFLLKRRSVKAELLMEPGPSDGEIAQILRAASRVPDHKKLVPWRFIVFQGEHRAAFGEVLAQVCAQEDAIEPSSVRIETEKARFLRAPLVIGLISRTTDKTNVPIFEQILSCGAAGQNLCLGANALGYGTNWLTEWYAFSPRVGAALGLEANERVAGFIHIGTPAERMPERDRPELATIVTQWTGQAGAKLQS